MQRRRAAHVEGDEGSEQGGGVGEAAGHNEVRVEPQEEARGGRPCAGEELAEWEAQRRHLLRRGAARGGGRAVVAAPARGDLNVLIPTSAGRRGSFPPLLARADAASGILGILGRAFMFAAGKFGHIAVLGPCGKAGKRHQPKTPRNDCQFVRFYEKKK